MDVFKISSGGGVRSMHAWTWRRREEIRDCLDFPEFLEDRRFDVLDHFFEISRCEWKSILLDVSF